MSTCPKKEDVQKIEEIGKLLISRLREARMKKGHLICPVCRTSFDGTHLIKCPRCRTLIGNAFQEIRRLTTSKNPEPVKNPNVFKHSRRSKNPKTPKNSRGSKNPGTSKKLQSEKLQLDFFA